MGLHDRDYYRPGARPSLRGWMGRSVIGTIIAINLAVWLIQVLAGPRVTELLAATAGDVFHFHVYKILTASFAHDPRTVWHVAWNMLFLYFFGRELEAIYGRRDITILYLSACGLSILAEVFGLHFGGNDDVPVLGASGAVMAVVMLFTLFYPTRRILIFFFIPAPVWILCAIYIVNDLLGLRSGARSGVAHVAHLTGAALGVLYWIFDLRWAHLSQVLGGLRRRGRAPRRAGKIIPFRRPESADDAATTAAITRRIDDLLAKISAQGKESLSAEEWAFLKDNASRYRSTVPPGSG